eukprot:scaffold47153_cov58-Phaeocystis_antarctica.AAC.2
MRSRRPSGHAPSLDHRRLPGPAPILAFVLQLEPVLERVARDLHERLERAIDEQLQNHGRHPVVHAIVPLDLHLQPLTVAQRLGCPTAAFQVCAEKAKRLHRLCRSGGGGGAVLSLLASLRFQAEGPRHLHFRSERLPAWAEEGQVLARTMRTRRAEANAPPLDHRCRPAAALQPRVHRRCAAAQTSWLCAAVPSCRTATARTNGSPRGVASGCTQACRTSCGFRTRSAVSDAAKTRRCAGKGGG